jgi:phosphohistidine phosphatase
VGSLRLTLLRHAHAQPQEEAAEDAVRELTARGRAEATHIGQRLARAGLVPDLIIASSAQRTQSTAQLVAAALALPKAGIRILDELYNAGSHQIWKAALVQGASGGGARAIGHLLVCCHNPGVSRLAGRLGSGTAGSAPGRALDLPPAGLVTALWQDARWESLQAEQAGETQLLLPQA